jgi:hypothetical protein
MSILAKSAGSIMPGRGLINPAFVIKIVPATDDMQQPKSAGRPNPSNDYLDKYEIGDEIRAKVDDEVVSGKLNRIIKNEEGDGVYALIISQDGKTHKIEGSQIMDAGEPTSSSSDDYLRSSPGVFNETKFMSFGEFTSL